LASLKCILVFVCIKIPCRCLYPLFADRSIFLFHRYILFVAEADTGAISSSSGGESGAREQDTVKNTNEDVVMEEATGGGGGEVSEEGEGGKEKNPPKQQERQGSKTKIGDKAVAGREAAVALVAVEPSTGDVQQGMCR
jgi:hypothetical protein